MAKKSKVVAPVRTPTRRQLTRWERERKLHRIAVIGFAVVLLLVLAIPAYGYYREEISRGMETVLRVDGRTFSMNDYYRILKLRDFQLQQSLAFLGSTNPQFQQFIQQQRMALPFQVLEDMVEDELIRLEAPKLGISATPDDIAQAMKDLFQRKPAEGEQADENKLREEADKLYQDTLKAVGLSDQEYKDLVIIPKILRDKLNKQLGDQVPTSGEQVHIWGIVVDKEEDAKDVLAKLQGGADFAKLAAEKSTDTASKDKGGDMGWYARGILDDAVEQAAFNLKPGEYSQPVFGTSGYYVLKLVEKEPNRPIEASQLETLKGKALPAWLQKMQSSGEHKVERFFDSDKQIWATNKLSRERPAAAS